MGKTQPSKRELNEQKKKEEEHAAAQVIILIYNSTVRHHQYNYNELNYVYGFDSHNIE